MMVSNIFLFSPLFRERFPIWLIFFKGVETTNQKRTLTIDMFFKSERIFRMCGCHLPIARFHRRMFRGWLKHPNCFKEREMSEVDMFHQMQIWLVVSNIFYFHPYLGKIPILTHICQMGWFNYQPEIIWALFFLAAQKKNSWRFESNTKLWHIPGSCGCTRVFKLPTLEESTTTHLW